MKQKQLNQNYTIPNPRNSDDHQPGEHLRHRNVEIKENRLYSLSLQEHAIKVIQYYININVA